MSVSLSSAEQAILEGSDGEGSALAMRIVVALGEVLGAENLLPISGAHVDGCLFVGQASLDFAERLVMAGARVSVPTTLNISSLDLLHPELFRGADATAASARQLMVAYEALGCTPTWTCAPYQLANRPTFGDHVAWGESNAIVFANSVLGARTNRYGDLIDICAAVTGRVPNAGLHRTELRRGQAVFDVAGLPERLLEEDILFPLLGLHVGAATGDQVPVVVGLPGADEDQLKAFGASAATSGSVGLFHAVGITPEAPDLATALHGRPAEGRSEVTLADLRRARDQINGSPDAVLGAVSVGTPHYSLRQIEELVRLLAGRSVHESVRFYMSTGRDTLSEAEAAGWVSQLEANGVQPVADTCTYVTPIIDGAAGTVMTDSAKWAYYAPGNIGVAVAFGSVADCVESAVTGRMVFDGSLWDG